VRNGEEFFMRPDPVDILGGGFFPVPETMLDKVRGVL